MKKTRSSRSSGDVVRLARLYGCGVPGLRKVSKASKRSKNDKSAFVYSAADAERCTAKLRSSEFFISNGVENFEGFENYYISLLDLNDLFDKSFQVKFATSEVAAFVQEHQCTELDSFREIKIIFNTVLKALKLLGNALRSENHSKIRKENEALLEFRLKHVEAREDDHIKVNLDPPALFNTLWEIHDACREHWQLKTKKFMELLQKNFNNATGVVDGEKLREFLKYNIDAKVSTEHCKMLILYLNGLESRLATTVAVHLIVMTLKLLAQDRQCILTPPADDEESYSKFCATVQHIHEVLTNESRAARIMNRTMKIAKREEKNRKKNIPGDVFAIPSTTQIVKNNGGSFNEGIQSGQQKKNNPKNVAILEPISSKNKFETGETRKGVNTKKTKEGPFIQKDIKVKHITKALTSNSRKLAPYVAHSTDVSRPGGASSILRAKTPLILDRPSNIRDRMTSMTASVISPNPSIGDDGSTKTSARGSKGQTRKRDVKESRLELCPVQLDNKGQGLRYDLRYRLIAAFVNVLKETRKIEIDDVIQAFWAKKQCEIGIGLDIMSENGVIVDRKSFVEVLTVILPKFLEANTLFSVLDPNRSGYISIHVLHALVTLYALPLHCQAWQIVEACVRAATWEVLNCRLHQNPSLKSTLSTANKAKNAAQIAAQQHLGENAAEMQQRELNVKLNANNDRLKDHLKKKVTEDLLSNMRLNEQEIEVDDGLNDAQREAFAIRGAFLPPGILNACLRIVCTSPETEKSCSLSLFIMIKKAQAENIWDEDFLKKNKGYTREDVSVGFAMDYLTDNEDESVFLKEELVKMHAKINAHAMMCKRTK